MAGLAAGSSMASFFVYPPEPRAGQDLVIYIDFPADCSAGSSHIAQASIGDGAITVSYPMPIPCGIPLPGHWITAIVNVPKAGTYTISAVTNPNASTAQRRQVGQVTVMPAQSVVRTSVPLAGLWLVASQPGWGLNIAEGQSGQLFLTWYTYGGLALGDRFGTSTWLFTSSGMWTSPTTFTGALLQPSGTFFTRPFNPALTILQPVGSSTVEVTGTDSLTYTVHYNLGAGDGASTYNLTRFKF